MLNNHGLKDPVPSLLLPKCTHLNHFSALGIFGSKSPRFGTKNKMSQSKIRFWLSYPRHVFLEVFSWEVSHLPPMESIYFLGFTSLSVGDMDSFPWRGKLITLHPSSFSRRESETPEI